MRKVFVSLIAISLAMAIMLTGCSSQSSKSDLLSDGGNGSNVTSSQEENQSDSENGGKTVNTTLWNNDPMIPIGVDTSYLVYDPNTKIVYYRIYVDKRGYMSVFYSENGNICRYNEADNMIEEVD